jgi:hypothetical protein
MQRCCIPCEYQKHGKQQEGRIRHLGKELEAVREEIHKLKVGNVSSNFMQEIWKNKQRIPSPSPGPVDSQQLNN